MHKYIFKRLLMLIPVLFGVALVVFFIMDMTPGDPAVIVAGDDATEEQIEAVREELGLNDPLLVRYGRYMLKLFQGDMGQSYVSKVDVFDTYIHKFPATLLLAIASIIVALIISIPLGIMSATHQNTWLDTLGTLIALLGMSMPNFWLGMMLILSLSNGLGLFPSGGFEGLSSLVLPAITEGVFLCALIMRNTRSSMLDVLRQDYIVTAKAKGVSNRKVIMHHAFRNALIPIITVAGMNFAYVLCGPVLTETVFSWPGVGRLVYDSICKSDTNMVTGSLILSCMFVSVVNLIVDLIYAFVDPRIKAQYKK